MELREWQNEAYGKIKSSGSCIIEATTGSGKTILGIKLVEDNPKDKILITVPTIVLQKQWRDELIKFGVATKDEINRIGGGHKDVPRKRITIAVVNSLRKMPWDNPLTHFDKVILDEVHRYASESNIKFLQEGTFGQVIGLTATLQRSDGLEEVLKDIIGPVVYRLTPQQAKDLGYVSEFNVSCVECLFTEEERAVYVAREAEINRYMQIFNYNYNLALDTVKQGFRNPNFHAASKLVKMISHRKRSTTNIESKKEEAIKIVLANPESKILLFDELQESANEIYKRLINLGIDAVLYHSGLSTKVKKEAIEKFKFGSAKVLVSVKALDEGLDVKEADVGIIVNGNSQKRQIIQRLGRILRKAEDKVATLYMLFVKNTQDQKYMQKRLVHLQSSNKITLV